MSNQAGTLYIVATPIGNLEDISARALRVLGEVDLIAAEDTRHSGKLLQHFGIRTPMLSVHEHNEEAQAGAVLAALAEGRSVAQISDAGTPLVSDPGFRLVRAAHEAGFRVAPVPGPSSVIAALSVAGLPTDRFAFEGFLPAKPAARRRALEALVDEPRTLVFLESPHRVRGCVEDLLAVFGPEREATLARELTKAFETVRQGPLGELVPWLQADANQERGEFVLIVAGRREQTAAADAEGERVLRLLLAELPLKQAAKLAAQITGASKNALYELGLSLADK